MLPSADELLNFNYPLASQKQMDAEIKIKRHLRALSYNKQIEREIERHSDKYVSSASREEIMKTVGMEMLSPELVAMFGVATDSALLDGDENYNYEEGEDAAGANDESDGALDGSLEGGDDYSGYFNDEDDLIDEVEQKDGGYM